MNKFVFAIRDDDLNFYTRTDEISCVYSDIWSLIPISFSTIPFVIDFKKYSFKKYSPKMLERPIGENRELVDFMRSIIAANKGEIMLHGYSHHYLRQENSFLAECIWKPENRLKTEIPKGKSYLEEAFGTKISVFVPPSNRIKPSCIPILEQEKLHLSGILGPFGDRPWNLRYFKVWWLRWKYWLLNRAPYPYPLDFGRHKELVAYALTPTSDYERLIAILRRCAQIKAPFVLATHYWELYEYPNLRKRLYEIVRIALEDLGAVPCKVSKCFEVKL